MASKLTRSFRDRNHLVNYKADAYFISSEGFRKFEKDYKSDLGVNPKDNMREYYRAHEAAMGALHQIQWKKD